MAQEIVRNRKAFYDYFIEDKYEAGLVLLGTEIKSIRQGKVQLKEAYISIRDGEAWIKNMHIAHYDKGNIFNHDETRDRKLLLHKKEINNLIKDETQNGYTIVPLSLYIRNGKAKLQIATAKGKKLHDKRQVEKERSIQREIRKAMKGY